jgi:Glycosyl transferase family 2
MVTVTRTTARGRETVPILECCTGAYRFGCRVVFRLYAASPMVDQPRVCFVSASGQNVFFDELLEAFREALGEVRGLSTTVAVDHFPALEDDLVYVLVPHEYVPLTRPSAHPTATQLARTVAICTEQPGTYWFEEAAGIASRCGAVIDINSLGAQALRERGINADLLPIGYVPNWDSWGGAESDRPIDVTFMGGATARRQSAIAACGQMLTSRRAALHLVETSPHTRESELFLWGRRKWKHLAASKILLNIHRDELGYFEWLRVIGAMANGCVVLTEHSLGIEPLEPGVHFVSGKLEHLPFLIDALLKDPARLASIRLAAYEFLRHQFRLSDSIHVLDEAARAVQRAAPTGEGPSMTESRPAPAESWPAPAPPAPPPTGFERAVEMRGNEDVLLRMAVKRVLLDQRDLGRAVARLETATRDPEAREIEELYFGPFNQVQPRVSVLISVFNYREHVEEAMRSAAQSALRDLELIVVDDGSTDDSAEVVTRTFIDMPWVAGRLVRCRHNSGLSTARNLGAQRARGEFVFILDADNTVYPHAFERLTSALENKGDAAFAYGLVEQHAGARAIGLLSWHDWDPRRLRFGNIIDAMAMIRRSALLNVGGFSLDARLFGWEDFTLWCAFAQRGWRGVQVPEVLGRYRVLGHSMLALTLIDDSEAWTALARKYPFLMSPADAPVLPPAWPVEAGSLLAS